MFLKATRLSRLQEGDAGMGFSRLQGYQGYRRWTLGLVSQGYKAIKATGGGGRDGFLKATRLSRLQEGDRGISFSRLQGYQGYMRGTRGLVSQGYKAIKATEGRRRDRFLKATRLSRPQEGYAGMGSRVVNRRKFHFYVSECYNMVDNRIGNVAQIIG